MPFEEFAARHNRPVAEVIDVFSACVQLPLLSKSAEWLDRVKEAREAVKTFQEIRREANARVQGGEDAVVQETQLEK
jgi:hypothetical protein